MQDKYPYVFFFSKLCMILVFIIFFSDTSDGIFIGLSSDTCLVTLS